MVVPVLTVVLTVVPMVVPVLMVLVPMVPALTAPMVVPVPIASKLSALAVKLLFCKVMLDYYITVLFY